MASNTSKSLNECKKIAFDPAKSQCRLKSIIKFLKSKDFEDLTQVPSIGPHFASVLRQQQSTPITTIYQLMGYFLLFRRTNISQEQWCQSMFNFLQQCGVRTDFVQHITYSIAERLDLCFPELFHPENFGKCTADKYLELPTFQQKKQGNSFDANKSTVSTAAILSFIEHSNKYQYANRLENVKNIGIGKATVAKLQAKGITSLYQVFGAFLTQCSKDINQEEWSNLCYRWCVDNGCSAAHSAGITDAICNALDAFFPGLYDREKALASK